MTKLFNLNYYEIGNTKLDRKLYRSITKLTYNIILVYLSTLCLIVSSGISTLLVTKHIVLLNTIYYIYDKIT